VLRIDWEIIVFFFFATFHINLSWKCFLLTHNRWTSKENNPRLKITLGSKNVIPWRSVCPSFSLSDDVQCCAACGMHGSIIWRREIGTQKRAGGDMRARAAPAVGDTRSCSHSSITRSKEKYVQLHNLMSWGSYRHRTKLRAWCSVHKLCEAVEFSTFRHGQDDVYNELNLCKPSRSFVVLFEHAKLWARA
jgi:hypothetical protein